MIAVISTALIGSCTNSSYEDMSRAADVADRLPMSRDLPEAGEQPLPDEPGTLATLIPSSPGYVGTFELTVVAIAAG